MQLDVGHYCLRLYLGVICYIKMLNNFYDILKNKETIINIDSLINYLTINKYNFKERYDFLMNSTIFAVDCKSE